MPLTTFAEAIADSEQFSKRHLLLEKGSASLVEPTSFTMARCSPKLTSPPLPRSSHFWPFRWPRMTTTS
jgi:hypothetical protein